MNKLVSYCLFSYNQEDYIEEALNGAVNQTYSPLEIIISDDASTDGTYEKIKNFKENYSGPHTIIINCNPINLGIGGHFSKVLYTLASGEYLTVLGGDDVSKSDHVSKAVAYLEQYPAISLIDFNADIIDEKSNFIKIYHALPFDKKLFTLSDYLQLKQISSFAPGRIFTKSLLSNYDAISNNCPTEDSVLVLRALFMGGLMRINERLVSYRRHSNNTTSASNMGKLSNLSIIAQYYRDLLKLYDDKKIDDTDFELVFKRIGLEYKLRKLKFDGKKSKLNTLSKVIRIKLLNIAYKR
ncbi:MAG: glycosyltransferase [Pedobacter sp.]|jgi:glycosyltransferase involved in cell wall biosynthesis|uniref:glycosyltransferase n=1 Tax=Pedobacter sp. TaxID=1411316 RepID=UPI003563ECDE